MSLAEAVLSVCDEMEKDGYIQTDDFANPLKPNPYLCQYAKQLRLLVKASEGAQPRDNYQPIVDKAKQRQEELLRAQLSEIVQRDERGESIAELHGDPDMEGAFVAIDPGMPIGAKTAIGHQVYQLREKGKLFLEPKK